MPILNIGIEKAIIKAKYYCNYQERCHAELREKLYGMGLYKNEVEQVIAQMIEENYLNEERFAISFAGGKFRMKKWGKQKIENELRRKKISQYCLTKALESIDNAEYKSICKKLTEDKLASLKTEKNKYLKNQKVKNYLLQKGYEYALIEECLGKNLE